jgi:AdoMet-dependent heme synthase
MNENKRRLPQPSSIDFDQTPFVAIWEITRACDLACQHCRAEAIPERAPEELATEEGKALLSELAQMGTPICVLSGGDPAKRPDLSDLIAHGAATGMRMATIPAATPLLTWELIRDLKQAGLAQMALSLDGPTAEVHDAFRGVPGAFDLTMQAARYAHELGVPLQINTTFSDYNRDCFDRMAELVQELRVVFWEVFFLVPMGRGRELGQMSAGQFEALFAKLAGFARSVNFIVKITEAPHYRRYLMQHRPAGSNPHGTPQGHGMLPEHMRRDFGPGGSIGVAPKGVNSGNGYMFVNYAGDIFPSGFLPLSCGNVRTHSVTAVYRSHPVFRELRRPELLKGKCGICEYRHICGGSRARAYAMTGDYLEVEPFCAYEPGES